ncbi:MAG: hypothetical protein KAI71_01460 [Candidatus Pacebacteria bacterium]|nr:hypothetical protein [Candidatus Paceibacterota bacterium]
MYIELFKRKRIIFSQIDKLDEFEVVKRNDLYTLFITENKARSEKSGRKLAVLYKIRALEKLVGMRINYSYNVIFEKDSIEPAGNHFHPEIQRPPLKLDNIIIKLITFINKHAKTDLAYEKNNGKREVFFVEPGSKLEIKFQNPQNKEEEIIIIENQIENSQAKLIYIPIGIAHAVTNISGRQAGLIVFSNIIDHEEKHDVSCQIT